MKHLLSRNGFTIFELMIVIAILGILASMAFDFGTNRHQVNVTRSERLANSLGDTIKGARDSMIIGRGVFTGGTYYAVTKRTIHITPVGITTYYTPFGSSSSGIENSLKFPFFDGDGLYRIDNLSVFSSRQTASTYTNLGGGQYSLTGMIDLIIYVDQKGIVSFSGSDFSTPVTSANARAIRINAIYDNLYHTLVFDRASGIVTISKPQNL